MPKFDKLTCMLEKLNNDEFGTWKIDNEHKGTKDDPMHFPFPIYTDAGKEAFHIVVCREEAPQDSGKFLLLS